MWNYSTVWSTMFNKSQKLENDLNTHMLYLKNKMCLWNTMPPIMANSNEGQDHKDKYFDTSRKILSQEMTMCNMEALVSYF